MEVLGCIQPTPTTFGHGSFPHAFMAEGLVGHEADQVLSLQLIMRATVSSAPTAVTWPGARNGAVSLGVRSKPNHDLTRPSPRTKFHPKALLLICDWTRKTSTT